MRLPLSAGAVIGLVRELKAIGADERPLVVGGAGDAVGAVRGELAEGGSADAVRTGGDARGAAAFVYVLRGPPTEDDVRHLRAAYRARVPIVCVQTAPSADVDIPYVLATDVVVATGARLPTDEIGRVIGQRLGEKATPLAAHLPRLRRGVCAALVEKFARQNGLLAVAIFLPGADLPALTLNQLRLVLRIAAAHGVPVDARRVPEVVGVIGAGVGLRAAARQSLGFIPVAGWAAKGAIAYDGTRALGEAAIRYFERAAAGPSPN